MQFLIGLSSGFFGGMVGLGGGVLMVPLLGALAHLPQYVCHGTSLLAVVFTGVAGALTYAAFGHTDLYAALLLAAGAFWPVQAGARLCRTLPEYNLRLAFGAFLVGIALLLAAKPWLFTLSVSPARGWFEVAVLLVGGAATGFLSGLMGVGGGAIMIAFMVLLAGFDQQTAQGTALLALIPVSILGSCVHWRLGSVDRTVLSGLIPGIVIGAVGGSWVAAFLAEPVLRGVFALVLAATGAQYVRAAPSCPPE